jgi:hypothetical protein
MKTYEHSPALTESPKRSPRTPLPTEIASFLPVQRLPQPVPRPRLPVRVAFLRPRHVKVAQVVWWVVEVRCLDRCGILRPPHGRQHLNHLARYGTIVELAAMHMYTFRRLEQSYLQGSGGPLRVTVYST